MADAKSAKIAILYEKNIAIITAPWPVHSFQGVDSEDTTWLIGAVGDVV